MHNYSAQPQRRDDAQFGQELTGVERVGYIGANCFQSKCTVTQSRYGEKAGGANFY